MKRPVEPTPTAALHALFDGAGRRTQLAQLHCKAPLKIAQTFALENALGVCVMDASPGLLSGDSYDFSWCLGSDSRVHVTTQGFTRVHPSSNNPCSLKQRISLEIGAHLELFAEPLMLYQDAALLAETTIDLAADATLLMGEVFCSGRIGLGEKFAFASYKNRVRVRREGKLVFVNQSALRPATLSPHCVGAWGDYTHSATFYVFGRCNPVALCELLRDVISTVPQCYGGASILEQGGVAVSLLGHRAYDLQSLIQQLRETASRHLTSI